MKVKTINSVLFLLSVIGLLGGFVLKNAIKLGICYANFNTNTFDTSCINLTGSIETPLIYSMTALAVVFFILLFVPQAFSRWWKFAIWYVPLATVFILWSAPNGSFIEIGPTPEQAALWFGGFYLFVSLIIVALTLRKKKTD